jgi:hypothetical protein
VAELVQLKLLMLLTYQKRLEEAVAQAGAHLQLFTRPPGMWCSGVVLSVCAHGHLSKTQFHSMNVCTRHSNK